MSREAVADGEELFRFQVVIRLSKWHKIQDLANARRRAPRDEAALLLEAAADAEHAKPVGRVA